MCAALTAAAACGGSSDPSACKRKAAAIAEHLRSINHEPAMFFTGNTKLVTRADLPQVQLPYAAVVQVTAADVSLMGQEVGGPEHLYEMLTANRMRNEQMPPGRNRELDLELVHILVDEDVPWEKLVWVADAVHKSGHVRPAFAFDFPAPEVKPPPRSKIDKELDELLNSDDAGNKATRFAEIAQKVIKGCAPLGEAFGGVAAVEGESKADTLINAIEPSLTKCHCSIDVPSFHSLMFRLLYVPDATTSLRVTLDPEGTILAFPGATPWREIAPKLAANQRISLAVEP